MQSISDTVCSVLHVPTKDGRPVLCHDAAIVWSDILGLGWRVGIAYNPNEWFAKVRLYLDHNISHTGQDHALASVSLRDSADRDAKPHRERSITLSDFGHGPPALLGSWSTHDLAFHPYVAVTVVTKARIPHPIIDPRLSATAALRQSMTSGDFVDTKFYAFSAKGPKSTATKPRIVYANSSCIQLVLPKGPKRTDAKFLFNLTGDDHISRDSVLHEYEYEQDSDLDDDEDEDGDDTIQPDSIPGEFRTPSSSHSHTPLGRSSFDRRQKHMTDDEFPADPPAYSVSTCKIVLVKGIAHKTWASYIFFRYTGQVSFLPLKSSHASPSDSPSDSVRSPSCSPKSMYRLASILEDERMKELAFRAITEGLSKDNIIEEAFSWFTAQYPAISEHQVERAFQLRKSPEVSSALKLQLKAVTLGEKPWAQGVLVAIMEKLNPSAEET